MRKKTTKKTQKRTIRKKPKPLKWNDLKGDKGDKNMSKKIEKAIKRTIKKDRRRKKKT